MGKLLIIAILIIGSLFVFIILPLQNKTDQVPELVSSNLGELRAKELSHEALIYGMRNIENGTVTLIPGTDTKTYPNFNVLEGAIDSIQYKANATIDTIEIISYVSCQDCNDTINHKSSALVAWVPKNVQAAISANSSIEVTGSATVIGNIIQNSDPPLSFEEVFNGITKEQMETTMADIVLTNPGNNPPCLDSLGIIWINGNLKVTNDGWDESGILVVNGDATFQGGSFSGIMWIIGDLYINGNNGFEGAIYVEGGIDIEGDPLIVSGNSETIFDLGAIKAAFAAIGLGIDYELKIVSLFEDYDL
ncbi:MAG: hypothetical protein DRI84_05765 [Bacteroidetes bacterium]|nr:MAG: hypothetical protein DRI84_05765 [Bacteroidota bacterium]